MGGIKAATIVGIALLFVNHISIYALDSFESGTFVRSEALGAAVSAVSLGADSLYKNPGAFTSFEGSEVQLTMAQEFDAAIFLGRAGYMGHIGNTRYSIQLPIKSIQGLVKTMADESGQGVAVGSYSDQQMTLMATAATDWKGASWGATVKALSQQIDGETGSGFGIDLGVLMALNPKMTAGASIRNVMESISWKGRSTETVPMALSAGLQMLVNRQVQVMADTDFVGSKTSFNIGALYSLSPVVELRAGINSVFDSPQIRLGVGIDVAPTILDYSFSQVELLGVSHRLGVRYVL